MSIPGRRGRELLDRVIVRVHARPWHDHEAHDIQTITLRLLSLLRREGRANLDTATQRALGMSFDRFRQRTAERKAMVADEFARLIPDYDPALGPPWK
jgi:hypothetical protein